MNDSNLLIFGVLFIGVINFVIWYVYIITKTPRITRDVKRYYSRKRNHKNAYGSFKIILINYDFKTSKEILKEEILNKLTNTSSKNTIKDVIYQTNDITLFNKDVYSLVDDILVLKKNGTYISIEELYMNSSLYTPKQIRYEHNIEKMLRTGVFNFINFNNKK